MLGRQEGDKYTLFVQWKEKDIFECWNSKNSSDIHFEEKWGSKIICIINFSKKILYKHTKKNEIE